MIPNRSSTEDENSASPLGESQTEMKSIIAEDVGGEEKKTEEGKETSVTEVDVAKGEVELTEEDKLRVEKASQLLAKWSSLKDEFRIPKKQRIEQMKEHEREAGTHSSM